MNDDFFDFDEHPENFYIMDEMINEDKNNRKSESCCSVLLIIAILAILITIA